jgi:hypothetical protein
MTIHFCSMRELLRNQITWILMWWISTSIPRSKTISNMFTIWRIWIVVWMQVWPLIRKGKKEMRRKQLHRSKNKRRRKSLQWIQSQGKTQTRSHIMIRITIELKKISCKVKIWKYQFRKKIWFNNRKLNTKEMKNRKPTKT